MTGKLLFYSFLKIESVKATVKTWQNSLTMSLVLDRPKVIGWLGVPFSERDRMRDQNLGTFIRGAGCHDLFGPSMAGVECHGIVIQDLDAGIFGEDQGWIRTFASLERKLLSEAPGDEFARGRPYDRPETSLQPRQREHIAFSKQSVQMGQSCEVWRCWSL